MKPVCPSCGRPLGGGAEAIERLCPACYVKRHGVARLPRALKAVYCRDCGAYRYQGGWNAGVGSVEETLKEYALIALTAKLRPSQGLEEAWIERIDMEPGFAGPGVYRLRARLAGRAGVVEVREEAYITLEAQQALCPRCAARATGRGYEAEVKIRSSSGRLSGNLKSELETFFSRLPRSLAEFVIKVDYVREGIDILMSDQSAARMLASKLRDEFSGEVVESYKLVGRTPAGKRRGRLTLSVRLPDLSPGDLIVVSGRPHLYIGRVKRGLVAIDLESGGERVIRVDREGGLSSIASHPGGESVRRYMVVSDDGESIVFLDVERDMQEVVDAPRSSVEVLTGRLEPGRIYDVYVSGNRIYVLRETDESGVEGRGKR
ncbi:MAG: hypothetical protein F7B20_02445 [Aeropyrum sp.]|nr:hypothetical protein [Aeropyrum sp.]MCE4615781.1 hypothetical protein [Aeropyrum sp.]